MTSSKNIFAVIVIATAMLSTPGLADDFVQDAGSWLQLIGEGSLGFIDPKLQSARVWLEGQSRFDDNWNHWYQGMVRVALGYSVTDRATIWAGYTWLPTQNVGKPYISQQDVWPGFRYVLPTDIGTVTFRTLIENNFIRGDQVRVRPRQMFRFMHPFEAEPRLSLVTWDEVFWRANSTPWGGQSGFDQNRAFAGLGWSFGPNLRTEVGYLNQYLDSANHQNHVMHHLIMGSIFFSW